MWIRKILSSLILIMEIRAEVIHEIRRKFMTDFISKARIGRKSIAKKCKLRFKKLINRLLDKIALEVG
mgnify:CR=1 FL=1